MIPILYKKDDTNYTRNGAGFLTDIISCDVTEERNGAYEMTFEYPATGLHYSDIDEGDVIKARANETSALQLFRIYAHSKPIDGIVTYNAEHISYDANGIPLVALTARSTTAQAAINRAISAGAFESGFTAWSDISTLNSIDIAEPCSLRAVLGGQQGSILDVWGGEYEFDNYVIKLHAHRGTDRGVTIEYGKNLTDIQQERNITETYTHIFPYAMYTEETTDANGNTESSDIVVTLEEKVLPLTIAGNVGHQKAAIINLSDTFEENEEITEQALRNKATAYIAAHDELGTPKVNIQASFISLWQTEEYKDIAPLERVQLCDVVTVRFVKLGISTKAKVIKTVYDTLNEKYKSVELGEARSSFADTVLEQEKALNDLATVVRKGFSAATEELQRAIEEATAAITGNSGGYVVLYPAEHPQEILIMDSPSIETAVHVWRWNSSGLGYSSTGYNGTYGLAMTMNGAIVADYITAGTLNGALLRADSVQANAISAGFKQQIANAITGAKETVEQEFAIADEALRSSITTSYTNAISASETRTQTLIQQTADGIMLQVYTKTETGNLIDGAIDDANDYTDTQLGRYYTKTETDTAITTSANALTLSFNTKLSNEYYTQTQTNSQIALSKASIISTVAAAENKYDEENYTITLYGFGTAAQNGYNAADHSAEYYLDQSDGKLYLSNGSAWNLVKTLLLITTELHSEITQTANDLTLSFNTKLLNEYYTQTQTNSQIALSKDSILTTVSNAQSKYDTSNDTVNLYGYGTPAAAGYAAVDNNGKYYLNQNNGYLYLSNGSTWVYQKALDLITNTLQAQITVNANAISTKVSSGDVISEINQSADTISLTAGRLVITTGNFRLDASGNATMSNATMTGSVTSGGTTGYRTKMTSGQIETYYDNSRVSVIVPVHQGNLTRTGFLASTNYHGLMLGRAMNNTINGYYYMSLDGDGYDQFDCRHYFVDSVKFAGQFRSSVNFINNVGVAWGGNIGLRYADSDGGAPNSGLWLGIGVNSCPLYINAGGDIHLDGGGGIKHHRTTYHYAPTWHENASVYVRGGYVDVDDGYGITCTGTIAFRWVNNDALYVGMNQLPLKLVGSNIYANGSPVATSSDSRQKQDIAPLADKYLQMIKAIDPVSFRYNADIALSGRTHTGFIAQNVLQAMTAAGITTSEFAAFVDVNSDGNEYALRYEEFISPLLAYIKHLEGRIEALETERTG